MTGRRERLEWTNTYARLHPSSKTTTDLLFLLDELAQGSRDALLMLIDIDPHRDLRDTRSANRGAYEPAVAIRREYHTWLQQQELKSAQDVGAQYDRIRLRLLTTIIDSTPSGYRAADARFLAGEILFNQKRVPEALSCWERIISPPARQLYRRVLTRAAGAEVEPRCERTRDRSHSSC